MTVTLKEIPGGLFDVRITSAAGENPVGPRLARGTPLPDRHWTGLSRAEAEAAAQALRDYLSVNARRRK